MAYTKTTWQDQPSTATPLSAANLNHLETQYDEAKAYADTGDASDRAYADAGDTSARAYTDAQVATRATPAYVDAGDAAAIPKALIDAKGDILAGSADNTPGRLPKGTDGQILSADTASALGLKWIAAPSGGGTDPGAIPKSLVDAKGDLIAATAADVVARLAIGTDGQVLTADAAQTAGMKWATPSSGGGGGVAPPAVGTRVAIVASDGGNTIALQGGWMNMVPVWVPVPFSISSLSVDVISPAAAPSTIKIGLYSVPTVGGAGTLLRDFGTITTETSGVKSLSGGPWAIPAGIYYIAALQNANAATIRAGGNQNGGLMQIIPLPGSVALGKRFLADPGGTVLPPTSSASPSPNGTDGSAMMSALIGVIA